VVVKARFLAGQTCEFAVQFKSVKSSESVKSTCLRVCSPPPLVEFTVSSFYHRPKGDRRRRGNNDARPCRSSNPGLAPRAAGLAPRSPDGRQEEGRRLVRSHAALVDPERRRRRFSPEFHVRWVLISTDVRSLFARPDSMLTLTTRLARSLVRQRMWLWT